MTEKPKYSGLIGNTNRSGKTKPPEKKRTSLFGVSVTPSEKGLLVAAAAGKSLAAIYRPVLLSHAKKLLKKTDENIR